MNCVLILLIAIFPGCVVGETATSPLAPSDLPSLLPAGDYFLVLYADLTALRQTAAWEKGWIPIPYTLPSWFQQLGLPESILEHSTAALIANTWTEQPLAASVTGVNFPIEDLLFHLVEPKFYRPGQNTPEPTHFERWSRPIALFSCPGADELLIAAAGAGTIRRSDSNLGHAPCYELSTKPDGVAILCAIRPDLIVVAMDIGGIRQVVATAEKTTTAWLDVTENKPLTDMRPNLGPLWIVRNDRIVSEATKKLMQASGNQADMREPDRKLPKKPKSFGITEYLYGDTIVKRAIAVCADNAAADAVETSRKQFMEMLRTGNGVDPRIAPPEFREIMARKEGLSRDGLTVIAETMIDEEYYSMYLRFQQYEKVRGMGLK